jgi:hypothetical protein
MWLAREQESNGKVFFSIHPPSIPRGGAGGLLEKKLKLLHANSRELQSRSCDCSGGAMNFSHFCRRLYRVKLRYTRKICGTVSLLHTILYSLFVGGPLRRSFFYINFTGFVADLCAFKGEEQQVSQCALVATNNK